MTTYTIEESTLTGIADAIREKYGQEKEAIPDIVVSKTPNATGFDSYEGDYPSGVKLRDLVHIPNASSIHIKIAYITEAAYDKVYICKGDQVSSLRTYEYVLSGNSNGTVEYTVEGDTITFAFESDAAISVGLGYYAECFGIDAEGKAIGSEMSNMYKPTEMAAAIDALKTADPNCTGMHISEDNLVISGSCNYRFANRGWDWFLEQCGDKITTESITNSTYMFQNTQVDSIPFDLNFDDSTYRDNQYMFADCTQLKEIGTIRNMRPSSIVAFFSSCHRLRYLPTFENLNMDRVYTYPYANASSMFNACYSLREIPESLLKRLYLPLGTSSYYALWYGFINCYALDEIKGLNPQTGTMTSNTFGSSFTNCHRLKNIIFATQEDGTPYVVNWKNQTIDISNKNQPVGFARHDYKDRITSFNSGITEDKFVYDDASYQALKDDPDWTSLNSYDDTSYLYSRYNHDSAVRTINSLPDTSVYLATAGGINTIKFFGEAGSKTDGGAINTLTEEEIAVATAKGWTVSFV